MAALLFRCLVVLSWVLAATAATPVRAADPIKVGSKRFTESYILGELARQQLERAGLPAEHRQGLGNTAILDQAVRSGQIDVYPEYTGTIVRELLKRPLPAGAPPPTLAELNTWLAPLGLQAAAPLGFNNTYALLVRSDDPRFEAIGKISDLRRLLPGTDTRR